MLKGKFRIAAFLTLIFSLAATAANAQKGTIRGTVLDAVTGEPLTGTTIVIEGTTIGTSADAEGAFTISNITPGRVVVTAHYLGYEVFRQELTVEADKVVTIRIPLHAEGINLDDVIVVAQIDNESENVLLSGQRDALAAIQSVGAAEMSRKGIGNARAAVAQVSGISQQEGVKNVFVRGLGDRYNATFLNGFPLPSEDPEYKNIALEFFGSDIIQSIGVSKVFSADNNGDVGGAAIDINSKELIGERALSLSLDGGFNSSVAGVDFLRHQDGVNYFGVGNSRRPTEGKFDFANRLDPLRVSLPLDHSYGASGGKLWRLGPKRNPLSVFLVASHTTDYSYTDKTIRADNDRDIVHRDQTGRISTIDINQLVLGNVDLKIDRKYYFSYNFMLIHAGDQYVADYYGMNVDKYEGKDDIGFLRRQQSNENLLLVHQLITRFDLGERWRLNLGAAYNTIHGSEPDRRENNIMLQQDGGYITTGSNAQLRFFSELRETDLNLKASMSYKLTRGLDIERSNLTLGYRGRMVNDRFEATEYFYGNYDHGSDRVGLDVSFDELYNQQTLEEGKFRLPPSVEHDYRVDKSIHSGYVEATHQFSPRFAANVGVQADLVDMYVIAERTDEADLEKFYFLPSLSLRYDPAERHSLRLGASKSYTLPQSKEISTYMYYNVEYSSAGYKNIKPSDNYNVDLKWDWYPSSSELVSLGVFYKYIARPIGRVDKGSSSLALTYDNIGKGADVAGVEFEMRKNIINTTTIRQAMRRLSVGLNASYIYSSLDFDIENTPRRKVRLEGASPLLIGGDVSYNYSSGEKVLNLSLVAGWFSDRVHTLGTRGYNDIIEKGVATLSFASSFRFNRHLTVKLNVGNILNRPYRLTRDYLTKPGELVLSEYKKGIDVNVGVSFDLW